MLKLIAKELKSHAPFTIIGAFSGVVLMVLVKNIPANVSYNLFYTMHPLHVLLSALVTTSLFSKYRCKLGHKPCSIWLLLVIGYVGSVGIATLSDSVIPYLGEALLDMPHRQAHIGFIEKWWLVNPLAILGIGIAYFWPSTKFPHFGHVFISTWASLFHIMLAKGDYLSLPAYLGIGIFLFLAVWLPCCISDIIFPLLFVKEHAHQH